MTTVSVSVIVPVYRGAPTVGILVERILAARTAAGWNLAEIILVDDQSPDDSWRVISDLADQHSEVEAVALARNFGQHAALLAGMTRATGDVIVTMDDDLQHRPEEVVSLLAALDDDVDLVYGQAIDEEHGWWRNVTSRLGKRIVALAAGSDLVESMSAFRAFRSWLVPGLLKQSTQHPSVDVPLLWATERVVLVRVPMDHRAHGQSNYSAWGLLRVAVTMLLGFSTLPLRAVSYIGVCMGLAGAGLLAFVLINYAAYGSAVPGFAFIGSMVALFSGVQLVAIGVIGEYLARLYGDAVGRPSFAIRRVHRANPKR